MIIINDVRDSCIYQKWGDEDPEGLYCFTRVGASHHPVCEDTATETPEWGSSSSDPSLGFTDPTSSVS